MKEKLLELMEKKEIRVPEVSEATGIPTTTLYSFINDTRKGRGLNAETLMKLSKFFEVPMEYFMEG